ncbi:MFS transporter [Corynebacterium striatum]|uniref:MFS transporter n=1 Tax=Corynebacterium striatum TaxID=43770 RepID=UPI002549FAA2|nr:MFS transporter [Corynebacterium striatum]MDK8844805.1 MFS transporter [Corynebacterium striatum]
MAAFGISVRASTLVMGRLLRLLPFAAAMQIGLVAASVSFFIIGLQPNVAILVVALLLAGAGINMNGSSIRHYLVESEASETTKLEIFGSINIAVNVSAAVGPVIGNVLFSSASNVIFFYTAACYLAAAVVPALTLSYKLRPRKADVRGSFARRVIQPLGKAPVRWVVLGVVVGYMLYSQLFSSIAVAVSAHYTSPVIRGAVFAVNALSVVLLQPLGTRLIKKARDSGLSNQTLVLVSPLVFVIALVAVKINPFLGIIIFSFAETLFIPLVDAALLSLPMAGSLEAVQARQLVVATGEGIGLGLGVIVAPQWIALSAAVLIVCCFVVRLMSGEHDAKQCDKGPSLAKH